MKLTYAVLGVLGLCVLGCGSQAKPASQPPAVALSQTPPAAVVLEKFREAVWNELLPQIDTLDHDKIQEKVSVLAVKHFAGNEDILQKQAQWELSQLPKAEPLKDSQWTEVRPKKTAKCVLSLQDGIAEMKNEGFLCFAMWSPVRMANSYRTYCLAKLLGPAGLSKYSMVEAFAKPRPSLLVANWVEPTIMFRTGPEAFIVKLRRNEGGVYELYDIKWLKCKVSNSN